MARTRSGRIKRDADMPFDPTDTLSTVDIVEITRPFRKTHPLFIDVRARPFDARIRGSARATRLRIITGKCKTSDSECTVILFLGCA